jgi:hypothetical protein
VVLVEGKVAAVLETNGVVLLMVFARVADVIGGVVLVTEVVCLTVCVANALTVVVEATVVLVLTVLVLMGQGSGSADESS